MPEIVKDIFSQIVILRACDQAYGS